MANYEILTIREIDEEISSFEYYFLHRLRRADAACDASDSDQCDEHWELAARYASILIALKQIKQERIEAE